MDAAGNEQIGERVVDEALAGDARLAGEGGALDDHGEVGFARAIVAHMAGVEVAVVADLERSGGEGGAQALFDPVGHRGGGSIGHPPHIACFLAGARVADDKKERPRARFHGRVEAPGRLCAEPGCAEAGEFRAPALDVPIAGRDGPPPFRWLCLDHVRAFNAGYNFFSGMSVEEIHLAQRPYAGWDTETRAFTGAERGPRWADFSDPLDAIAARFRREHAPERSDGKPLSGQDRASLKVLELAADADRSALRRRYSELVRRYHPDRNGGDRSHEARLQAVIAAYQQLRRAPAFA